MTERSPFAPEAPVAMPPIVGVRLATAMAGVRYAGRRDVVLMRFEAGTTVAGAFTTSRCPSAPVDLCRMHLPGGAARALVVNSGNANAFTGKAGAAAARDTVNAAARACGAEPETVFVSSTGVIGEPLDASRITRCLDGMAHEADANGWHTAAEAIMTTDTFAKCATATVDLDGTPVTINGIAKGAGMIAPDMATMLAYIATDAAISAPLLQQALSGGLAGSFNAITVDSDTSTSDTVLVFATGKAPMDPIGLESDGRLHAFRQALHGVMHDLALQIIGDGEGITKRMKVTVSGAASDGSARRIALSVANSPLVKTALAGGDPNWGRIVAAVGKAGEPADRDRLAIHFGTICVARDGLRSPDYDEQRCAQYMAASDIEIGIDLGLGPGASTVWGCDLTADYVSINADYRS